MRSDSRGPSSPAHAHAHATLDPYPCPDPPRPADAFDELRSQNSVEAALMPCIGGLTTGVLALGYPEILYQVRLARRRRD